MIICKSPKFIDEGGQFYGCGTCDGCVKQIKGYIELFAMTRNQLKELPIFISESRQKINQKTIDWEDFSWYLHDLLDYINEQLEKIHSNMT